MRFCVDIVWVGLNKLLVFMNWVVDRLSCLVVVFMCVMKVFLLLVMVFVMVMDILFVELISIV